MMKKTILAAAAAVIALPLTFGAAITPAEAGYKSRIVISYGGGGGCYWMKQKAKYYESAGKWGKAEYWWNRYYDCKNNGCAY